MDDRVRPPCPQVGRAAAAAARGETLLGPDHDDPAVLLKRFRKAKERRTAWESHWQECYDYALPLRDSILYQANPGEKKADRLFDGTAPDAVDQLAASMLSELTPPWAKWFGLTPGHELSPEDRDQAAPALERIVATLQSHFDRSNFSVEMHQCYLDAVTGGTASLLFEEAPPGEPSAFRFTAVPLSQLVLEEGPEGRPDISFRRTEPTMAGLRSRFPTADLPDDMVRQAAADPDLRRSAEVIRRAAERGRTIVDGLLRFSQGAARKPEVLDLRRAAEEAIALLERGAGGRGIRLGLDAGPTVRVRADPTEIQQVLLNLVKNAVEASPAGHAVEIGIGAAAGRARIEVRDRGQGIPGAAAARVFEPFFTTREREGGSGLGLAIAHGIVVGLRGALGFSPRAGGGTVFTVELPFAEDADGA